RGVCVLGFFVHALVVVVSTDADDLIAARRSFRRGFLAWLMVVGIVITLLEIAELDRALPPWVFAIQAAIVFGTVVAFLVWSMRLRSDIWIAVARSAMTQSHENPAQSILAKRIEDAMADGLWRQESLTVADVARQLATQEHRVRTAINQCMGHKNFASYVNGFRVVEAQNLLGDPQHAERTVLSIAFDVGFSSLGPFNRAFRSQSGMTPTAYRKARLRDA
ncbi:MAG: AraC family transcriptional regulator, partial [Pseudomonadota bacterium]